MLKLRALGLALLLAVVMVGAASTPAYAHHKPCHPKSLCEVPEVPWTLVLPAASAGMAGAYYLVQRTRGGDGEHDDASEAHDDE